MLLDTLRKMGRVGTWKYHFPKMYQH